MKKIMGLAGLVLAMTIGISATVLAGGSFFSSSSSIKAGSRYRVIANHGPSPMCGFNTTRYTLGENISKRMFSIDALQPLSIGQTLNVVISTGPTCGSAKMWLYN